MFLFALVAASSVVQGHRQVEASGPYTLDTASWTSPVAYSQGPLTLSVRITSSMNGYITKVRFYKDPIFTGSHIAYVWDSGGHVLTQENFTNETASGWQEVTLSSPVTVNSGVTYSVGYTLDNGFAVNNSAFPSHTAGPLTIIDGYYKYAASTFPDQTVHNNYLIDFTFADSISTTTTLPPTTTTTLPYSLTNAVWGTAGENGTISLTAPSGSLFSNVLFASYGTPTGSNGAFQLGSCHAANSANLVAANFIGQASGSISATNGVFGDPCFGTSKQLAVVLEYTSVTPTSTTTTSTSTTTTSTTTTVPLTTSTSTSTTSTSTTSPIVVTPQAATTSTSTTSSTSTSSTSSTSTTVPVTTTTTIPTNQSQLLNQLNSGSNSSQVASIVSAILSTPVTPEVAGQLASNPGVLGSISASQASQIFEALNIEQLDPTAETALVVAVSSAPPSIKNAFENKIDVYASGLTKYVPNGSKVNVGTRRSIIAATAAVSGIAAAGSGALPRGRDTDGGGSGGRESDATMLESRRLSIARRRARNLGPSTPVDRHAMAELGSSMKTQSRLARMFKTLGREISAMAFTLAGSVIVLATLSGQTRKIALIATSVAMVLHFGRALLNSNAE